MSDENSAPDSHPAPRVSQSTRTKVLAALALAGVLCGLCVVWPRLILIVLMTAAVFALLVLANRQQSQPKVVEDPGTDRPRRGRRPAGTQDDDRIPVLGDRLREHASRGRRR
jgi:hypothetical protein